MELTLPVDVLLHIIDLLAAAGDDEDSIRSLQTLSITCKYMVPICRKYLFSSLRLRSKLTSERFSDLLLENPDFAHYVRSLNYRLHYSISDHELIILDILKVRSPLQSITLSSSNRGWDDYPESIRLSLLSLIEMPTVTHLDIDDFRKFPATALSGCSNLINLQLGDVRLTLPEFNHAEFDHVISRSRIPAPVSLNIRTGTYGLPALLNCASLHAGGPINFSRVQKVKFEVESEGVIDNINRLIKVTRQLQYIYITMHKPLELAGLGESLAISNAYRTLKSLGLSSTILNDNLDLFCGLNSQLGLIAGINILEEIQLDVLFQDASSYLTNFEFWSTFDSMLTDSGAFPMLRRVSVGFRWFFIFRSLSEHEQDVLLGSLEENMFPRLVESKVVELIFSADEIH